MKYPNPDSKSAAMFERAQTVLTEGGSRSTIRIAPYSIYVREAQGKYITDVDGNKLVDLNFVIAANFPVARMLRDSGTYHVQVDIYETAN